MTAEIAVINKSAVALAADSAVTITNSSGSTKIYNGAEKLFALTKYHPVGIMIFGSGTLCSVPWELVIKQYRKQLGQKSFDTLDGYAENFFSFLEGEETLIPKDLRFQFLENYWSGIYLDLWEMVYRKVQEIYTNADEVSDQDTFDILKDICNRISLTLDKQEFLTNFTQADIDELSIQCNEFIGVKSAEQGLELPVEMKAALSKLLAVATAKENTLGPNSGVVFAGYGDKEYFPTILAFDLKGFWEKKLRRIPDLQKSCGGGMSAIEAYAQDEEALTFMQGVSPSLKKLYEQTFFSSFDSILNKAIELIEANTTQNCDELKANLHQFAASKWVTATDAMANAIQRDYIDRVVHMVEFLPKDELAYMAESLVNMTAFKRKVTNDSETVGGPIDVAVISKGDGFVWIKRKHYFDGGLNNHYFEKFAKRS
ncbi:MAG: hypothetical protein CL591_13825 [Alteromonas sp.]|nr:hypothetical protein [Alteromonas sp.]|tara:strand:- start:13438 stop:14721 length:1284 start_codon:yes stop_codon:yes gene_type:complete